MLNAGLETKFWTYDGGLTLSSHVDIYLPYVVADNIAKA